jgi:hypothetical protein
MAAFGGLGGLGGFQGSSGMQTFGDILQALGHSLLTSPSHNMLQGLPAGMEAANRRGSERASQGAMVAALKSAGFTDDEALSFALNPAAAEIALKAKTQKENSALLASDPILGTGGPTAPAVPGSGPRAETFDPTSIPAFVAAAGGQHGISPDYMQKTAWIESRGNPRARNPSGASGLFQFMPGTAAQYGLRDPFNGEASADAAARLAADNRNSLKSALRRDPTDAELYLAHQQGAGGASALLRNPNASAHEILTRVYGDPDKAAAAIKQNGGDLNMTAGQFAGLWTGKFDALGRGGAGQAERPPAATRTAAMTLPPEAAGGGGGSAACNPAGRQHRRRRSSLTNSLRPRAARRRVIVARASSRCRCRFWQQMKSRRCRIASRARP